MYSDLTTRVRAALDAGDNQTVRSLLPGGWESEAPQSELALLYHARATADWKLGDFVASCSEYRLSYELLSAVENAVDACWIVIGYASALGHRGDHKRGAELLEAAAIQYKPTGVQLGFLLYIWGMRCCGDADTVQGIALMEQAISTLEGAGDVRSANYVRLELADQQARLGKGGIA